jgi:RHS repeat-associated protein
MRRGIVGLLLAALMGLSARPVGAQQEVVEYYHLDAVASVRAVTDANGQVVRRHDYFPFGEEYLATGSLDRLRFTGKARDLETGLDYFGARYYASPLGRFTTVDPVLDVEQALVDPQRWNRYAYALNNPLRFTDPDGRDPRVIGAALGAAVYAAWNAYVNVQQGQPWYQNIGVEAGKGLLAGVTLGLAAPVFAGTTTAEIGMLTSTVGTGVHNAGVAANVLGLAREAYVAQLVGGRVAGDVKISLPGVGTTAIDVYGKAGEFIGVGGPVKALKLSQLGTQLKVLAAAAEQAGVRAQYFFARGTSPEAFRLAEKWLGKGNVHWYELPR